MVRPEVGRIKGKKFSARIERIETEGGGRWKGKSRGFERANFSPRYLLFLFKELELFRKILR